MKELVKNNCKRVTGVGASLMDILVHEDDAFLNSISDIKGGMTLVEDTFITNALLRSDKTPDIVPGGAACNAIIGIGKLGGEARFIGKRGGDEYGTRYENDIKSNGVEPRLFISDTPTGRVLAVITPDSQRSFFTYLGASQELTPEKITAEMFDQTAIAFVEGYLLFNTDLMMAVLNAAKKAGALIALDLASFTVVEESKSFLYDSVIDYVDILIANEDEARAFTGVKDDDKKALSLMAEKADIAVLKVGKNGSFVSYKGEVTQISPEGDGAPVVDTTGAGDLWAAGFLYGLVEGFDIQSSGKLASLCGYEVCQVTGANIPHSGWQRIKATL